MKLLLETSNNNNNNNNNNNTKRLETNKQNITTKKTPKPTNRNQRMRVLGVILGTKPSTASAWCCARTLWSYRLGRNRCSWDVPGRKWMDPWWSDQWVSYNLLRNGVFLGVVTHLLTMDPNFPGHPGTTVPKTDEMSWGLRKHVSYEKKTALFSIEILVVSIGILTMVYYNPHITG